MREVVKKEVIKLLDVRIIYPVPHSEWVSPVHCVPKKGGLTVVKNEKNELISQKTMTRWLLTDKRRIPLRSASVRTPLLFHHGIPKVLVNSRSKGITSVQSTFTLELLKL
jgi:hypothetical protein